MVVHKSFDYSIYRIFFILFIFSITSIKAQTTINPDSALKNILNSIEGTPITLFQAKKLAGENSTFVKKAEAIYQASLGALRRERGIFDPEFYFNLNYTNQKTPTASFFAGAPILSTQQTNTETGLRLNLPIGTELEFALNSVRLETNSSFAFLNPEYDAYGTLSIRQPLLSGFTASGRENLEQAELNAESSKALYDQAILKTDSDVEQSYWNLYAAERDYAVQQLSLKRAEAVLKEAKVRESAGLVGPNQVANAKTFWAEQKILLIDRAEQLDNLSDQLIILIGKKPEFGNSRFLTVDNPPKSFTIDSLDEILEHTLNNNFDLLALKKNIEAANSNLDAASWKALPRVNLVGSLTSNALGGNSQDIFFGGDTLRSTTSGNFSDVLSQVFKRKFPGWSVGLEISLPIGLRKGLGEEDRLEAGVLNAKQNYIELSRQLESQVRKSYRELLHGNNRLEASKEGVEAAQEQVRIGMIQFQNGRLTAFELVRLSEDYALAQQRYSNALVKIVNAAAELKQLSSGYYSPNKKMQ